MARRKVKRELERNTNYFFEFLKIQKHFFKEMNKWLKVKDHRHKSYVKYPPEVILIMVILKNLCNLEAMRNMTDNFNKDECIENIRQLLGLEELEELPHYDTINDFLTGLKPSELEKIRAYMIKELLKKRCFEGYRINNKPAKVCQYFFGK